MMKKQQPEKQTTPYDNGFKRLMRICIQDLLTWLTKDAVWTGNRSKEFQSITIEADEIHEVIQYEQIALYHFEAQSGPDPDIPQRLLEYCVLAHHYYPFPMEDHVIFLKDCGPPPQSPLVWYSPDGQEILRFHFHVHILAQKTCEELFAQELPGILPFVPFTIGGKSHDVIERIITILLSSDDIIKRELLAITQLFASLAFDKDDIENQTWLARRFAMHRDIFRDTPAYQYIMELGREEEREKAAKAIEKALEHERKLREEMQLTLDLAQKEAKEAKLKAAQKAKELKEKRKMLKVRLTSLRTKLFALVDVRFPDFAAAIKEQIIHIKDPEILEDLFLNVAITQTPQEILNQLQEWEDLENA